jgi:alpha-N-arabinofuranosidase
MVLTPTYFVFKMFRVHQESKLLTTDLRCEDYSYNGKNIPAITASASVDTEGRVHITLANLNPSKEITVTCPVIGDVYKTVTGEVLTASEMNALNSFEKPDAVKTAPFSGFKLNNNVLTITMPAKSVVAIELKK